MSEPFQPTRPLPPAWPDLAGYAQSLETRIAELEKRPCPHVIVTTEGTGYCRLADEEAKNLRWARDEMAKKSAKTITALTIHNTDLLHERDELKKALAAHEPASLEWTRVVRAATDDGPHAMPLETDVADWVREMRERLNAAETERDNLLGTLREIETTLPQDGGTDDERIILAMVREELYGDEK